ncbi:MAG: FAD-dependent oxidoreductase, partial [Vicinamibacterales bacterium]
WELCRDSIQKLGHPVLLNHHVTALEMARGKVVAVRANTPDGVRRFPSDHVISTMPVRSLARSFEPAVPDDIRSAAEGLRYRDFLMVALILDRDKLFADNWIYVHTPGLKVGRVQNFNNWSAAMVPHADQTCLGMEYFCFKGDGLWDMKDADLVQMAFAELGSLGLAPGASLIDSSVVRMPKAYPIYDAAYRANLDKTRSFLDPIPNLHTIGRNGMHKYNNQDHSMLTAMMTVWNMQGASHDVWEVNTDFDYHEEQRVNPQAPASTDALVSTNR